MPYREPDHRAPVRDQLDQVGGGVHAVLGPERHVLQAVGPGRHRVRDRGDRVRVRGHLEPVPVRLVDRGPQHLGRELAQMLVGAWRQGPAAGHDLDDVDAALHVLAHRGPHPGLGRLRRPAQVVAVPGRRGDRRPGREDGRQPRPAAQPERQVVPVAQVPDRGDAAGERRLPGPGHRLHRLLVGPGRQCGDRVRAGVEGQVDVGVDQPGQQRRPAQVDDVRAVRRGRPGADGDDGAAVDHDQRVRDQGGAGAVEQPRGPQGGQPPAFGNGRCRHAPTLAPGWPRRHPQHIPLHFQSIAHPGACGKTRVVPHNG